MDRDDAGQQVNVTYTVAMGPQARVGEVTLRGRTLDHHGDSEFRKKGKLKREDQGDARYDEHGAEQPARTYTRRRTGWRRRKSEEVDV